MNSNNKSATDRDNYAQQWIDFLRKRNTVLNVLWPTLLCSTVIFALAAFYFYQQGHTTVLDLSLAKQSKLAESEKLAQALENQTTLKLERDALLTELSDIKESSSELSAQHSDSELKINANAEIIENLKIQLSLLQAEKETVSQAFSDVRDAVNKGQSLSQAVSTENKRLLAENTALSKTLQDRKTAYLALVKRQREAQGEMDRLADLVSAGEDDRNNWQQRVSLLSTQRKVLNEEKRSLQKKLSESIEKQKVLENRLSSLMAPIGDKGQSAAQQISSQDVMTTGKVEKAGQADITQDGLEELKLIKRPQKAPIIQAPASGSKEQAPGASFDYDRISVN
jgi:chromosome segregation ATPase